jgi:uncharacterized protein (DUF1499 family)
VRWLLGLIGLALAAGLMLAAGGILWNRVPLLESPGPMVRLQVYLTRNTVETAPDAPLPEHRPRTWSVPPEVLFPRLVEAVTALGWGELSVDGSARTVTAVVETPLWRFQDDVVVRVAPAGEGESTLHFHSRSRTGRGDLGANTRHLLDLYGALAKELAEIPNEAGSAAGS